MLHICQTCQHMSYNISPLIQTLVLEEEGYGITVHVNRCMSMGLLSFYHILTLYWHTPTPIPTPQHTPTHHTWYTHLVSTSLSNPGVLTYQGIWMCYLFLPTCWQGFKFKWHTPFKTDLSTHLASNPPHTPTQANSHTIKKLNLSWI